MASTPKNPLSYYLIGGAAGVGKTIRGNRYKRLLTIADNPHRDVSEDLNPFLYLTELPGTPQGNTGHYFQAPNGSSLLCYTDDTECKFVGRLYHTDYSVFDPANPGLFDEVAGFWFKHKAKVDREPGVPYNDDGSDSSEEERDI